MSTILDELKSKKRRKVTTVKAKIDANLKEKIDFICKESGIKSEEYLGQILEKSELNKVYTRLKNELKNSENDTENEVKEENKGTSYAE